MMAAEIPVGPGTSGSPILDCCNKVVALHWASGSNPKHGKDKISFGVPIDLIKKDLVKKSEVILQKNPPPDKCSKGEGNGHKNLPPPAMF